MASILPLPPSRPGVVVLLSGGLDSAVMTLLALAAGDEVWPLYVRQGFIWEEEELGATQRFLAEAESTNLRTLRPLVVATLAAPDGYASRWAVDGEEPVPDEASPDEAVYLPGRNLALLTQAAMLAYSRGLGRIQLGLLGSNPFPDSRADFFRAFESAVREGMNWTLRVEAPLAGLSKVEALMRSPDSRGLGETLSCIRPKAGIHCGRCNKCEERRRAFAKAGMKDGARYMMDREAAGG